LRSGSAKPNTIFNFKLEEEEKPALLLHLPKLIAETTSFDSGFDLDSWLVVETVQPTVLVKAFSKSSAEGYT
jgi:hypothetical protein